MKLIIGLGNPGKKYNSTRHNIGFAVIDRIARSFNTTFRNFAGVAEISDKIDILNTSIILAKPITYMNESGLAVRKIIDYYKIPVSDTIVIVDDLNINLGVLRFRTKGSAGGHNGLKSIIAHLGSNEFSRLRLGVGPAPAGDTSDFVLSKFSAGRKKDVDDMMARAQDAVELWLNEDELTVMNKINGTV
ncbi:MAG: aminoacyl-tRNA hydrolase [Elusimicrobiota bacterium]